MGSPIPPITDTEMASAINRMNKKLTAPRPDGVPGKALALALTEISPLVRDYLNRCLQAGYFPKIWKNAKLVLIQKPGRKDPFSPSSYRPICLLDEIGKLFERIISRTGSTLNFHYLDMISLITSSASGKDGQPSRRLIMS